MSDYEEWSDFESSGSEYLPENDKERFDSVKKRILLTDCDSSLNEIEPEESLVSTAYYFSENEAGSSSSKQEIIFDEPNENLKQHRLVDYSSSESDSEKTPIKETPKQSRKRGRHPTEWKKNIRRKNYQSGKEHVNSRGHLVQQKVVKPAASCALQCRFKCKENFSEADRQYYKDAFYTLNKEAKTHFLLNHSSRVPIKRKKSAQSTFRSFSFQYYFTKKDQKLRICKDFF